jgi:hypothetical protein
MDEDVVGVGAVIGGFGIGTGMDIAGVVFTLAVGLVAAVIWLTFRGPEFAVGTAASEGLNSE